MSMLFFGVPLEAPKPKAEGLAAALVAQDQKPAVSSALVRTSELYWGRAQSTLKSEDLDETAVREFRLLMCSVLSDLATHSTPGGGAEPVPTFGDFRYPFPLDHVPGYTDLVENPLSLCLVGSRIHSGYYDPTSTSSTSSRTSHSLVRQWAQFQDDVLDVFGNAVLYHSAFNLATTDDVLSPLVDSGIKGMTSAVQSLGRATQSFASSSGTAVVSVYDHLSAQEASTTIPAVPSRGNHALRLALHRVVAKVKKEASELCQHYARSYAVLAQYQAGKSKTAKTGGLPAHATAFFDAFASVLPSSIGALENQILLGASRLQSLAQLHRTLEWMLNFVVVCGGCQVAPVSGGGNKKHQSLDGEIESSTKLRAKAIELRNHRLPKLIQDALAEVKDELNTPLGGAHSPSAAGSDATSKKGKRNRDTTEDAPANATTTDLVLDDLGAGPALGLGRSDPGTINVATATRSAITAEDHQKLLRVVDAMQKLDTSQVFSFPVLEPRDYVTKVTNPIDFATIRFKLVALTMTASTGVKPEGGDEEKSRSKSAQSKKGVQHVKAEETGAASTASRALGYRTVSDVLAEFELLVDNCLAYNGPDHAFSTQIADIRKQLPVCCANEGLAVEGKTKNKIDM